MPLDNTIAKRLPDYLEMLWHFAYRLTQKNETAQELTQETCLRALEYQASFHGGSLKSWLFKIMHNLWRDEVRHNVRTGLRLVTETTLVELVTSTDTSELQMLLVEIQLLISQLPEAQRIVLLLIAVEGFTYQEAAEILKVPIGTIMSRLARARKKIGQTVVQNEAASQLPRGISWKK